MFDVIDKSTLKPGDVVGIRMKTQIRGGGGSSDTRKPSP